MNLNLPSSDSIQLNHELQMPSSIVKCTFVRRGRVLSCEIMVNGPRSFDVCVIPHWDVSSSVIEACDAIGDALLRHAELTSEFRDAGWVRVSEITTTQSSAA